MTVPLGGSVGTVPANNGRVPNNITCSTVLPNGRTVGSYVGQVSNSLNHQAQVAPVSTPYGPAPTRVFLVQSQSLARDSGTNFRAMFGGPGANYAFLGDAGNFAYGAVSANLGVPLLATEMVAGAYSLYAHPSSDWGWPYGMAQARTKTLGTKLSEPEYAQLEAERERVRERETRHPRMGAVE